jgi:hypothetical protein
MAHCELCDYPRVYVNVTAEDIELGVRSVGTACPVARAVRRDVPSVTYVNVDFHCVDALVDDERVRWELPSAVKAFMARFDRGEPVQPFAFTLPV